MRVSQEPLWGFPEQYLLLRIWTKFNVIRLIHKLINWNATPKQSQTILCNVLIKCESASLFEHCRNTEFSMLTWYNVQWKWFVWISIPTCASNPGPIARGSSTEGQGWNQALPLVVIIHNYGSKLPPGRGTLKMHGDLSKFFISPEHSLPLSCACEGNLLWEAGISPRGTAAQCQP